ncbi:hypothetical protein N3K66_006975 [Trichothecium roseum]|uniref:Uncharacterized protein n=1 Tax=Trichothecium roseum TaxID=47278 RepID=A0ACC0UYJ5_9HYPO|nr:hypothetical protein N3K66_006975 [Trichothecium roseum]
MRGTALLNEAKKFARVLFILQISHNALVTNMLLTKRHIYYQNQELFDNQRQVDILVDNLAWTFGAKREELNIIGTPKGVVTGSIVIYLKDDNRLDASIGNEGVSIPPRSLISRIDTRAIRWVLVIEKDAVFRSLASSRFWLLSSIGGGLIITAKGYPDLITCSFIDLIRQTDPNLPFFALVDCDPDGFNILRCYRSGFVDDGTRDKERHAKSMSEPDR